MSEKEGGFSPENPDLVHDISQAYRDSSPEEFMAYLEQFPKTTKLELRFHVSDINPDSINNLVDTHPVADVYIAYDDKQDYEMWNEKVPATVQWIRGAS